MYSIKMRASEQENHISGAEKMVPESGIVPVAGTLLERGMHHAKGEADFINLRIEKVREEDIRYLDALPVTTIEVADYRESYEIIARFLSDLGGKGSVKEIMELFRQTWSMRGAMLLDVDSLKRLEPDHERGIRVTYMDRERTGGQISSEKDHYMEAIVLATKVANAPGIVGEICISDDPDYVTGYVCSREKGYVRITRMKEMGSPLGGRIFLYSSGQCDVAETIDYLEKQRVIVRNVFPIQSEKDAVGNVSSRWLQTVISENAASIVQQQTPDRFAFIEEELSQLKKQHLYRTQKTICSGQSKYVEVAGKRLLMLASNSYLDLISDPRVKAYASRIALSYGAGSGGSRLTTGNTDLHVALEENLAAYKKCEAAIVFNTGYVANLATISALAGEESVIFSDELNHASVIDGCRLSRAKVVKYKHNDMEDLECRIREYAPCRGLAVSDAVFSMDGDVLQLPGFVEICRSYQLISMIDEAHSTGVLGETGHGIWEQYGYRCARPDIIMGTLSKSVGSEGGFVCADAGIIDYLRNKARGYIFSTSLSPVTVAASLKALEIMENDAGMFARLRENIRTFCAALQEYGIHAESETAIVPILVGDEEKALQMQEKLFDAGYYISVIRYPTVAHNQARLRVAVMASHTREELRGAAKVIAERFSDCKNGFCAAI